MLILTRRMGETVMIGTDVTVTVMGVNGNQVRLGINAPRDVAVHREDSPVPGAGEVGCIFDEISNLVEPNERTHTEVRAGLTS